MPSIALEEVAKHDGRTGVYWSVLWNKVYDITTVVKEHPGGSLARLAAGRDGTCLVESYHVGSITKVKAMLEKRATYLGELQGAAPIPDDAFYRTLRARVEDYLKSKGKNRHFNGHWVVIEMFITLVLYIISTYYNTFHGSVLGAAGVGFFTGRMGFLMHTGNHGGVSKNPFWSELVGRMMDLVGASRIVWMYDHQISHHVEPNNSKHDNDCTIATPVIRMHPDLEKKWWHQWQVALVFGGMSTGMVKWYFADIGNMLHGQVGHVNIFATRREIAINLAHKILFFIFHILLPFCFFPAQGVIFRLFVIFTLPAYYLECTFIVNHIQSGLVPPKHKHWAEKQVMGSCNWASQSQFWNWASGGLNHQIEHHLFPGMSIYLYPEINPIVKQTCKEFNIPVKEFPTFTSAMLSTVGYLTDLGDPHKDLH